MGCFEPGKEIIIIMIIIIIIIITLFIVFLEGTVTNLAI